MTVLHAEIWKCGKRRLSLVFFRKVRVQHWTHHWRFGHVGHGIHLQFLLFSPVGRIVPLPDLVSHPMSCGVQPQSFRLLSCFLRDVRSDCHLHLSAWTQHEPAGWINDDFSAVGCKEDGFLSRAPDVLSHCLKPTAL